MVNRQPLSASLVASGTASSTEAPPLDWPTLAELPWIDDLLDNHAAYTAASYRLDPGVEHDGRIVPPPRYARLADMHNGDQQPAAASAGSVASYAESSHRWRIDPAVATIDQAPPPHTPSLLPQGGSLAARLLQTHAVLAPYGGVAMTAALVAAVGILSWLTFGPRPAPSAVNTSIQSQLWPQEKSKAPLTLEQPPGTFASPEDLSQFSWSARLLPKPVPAHIEEPSAPIAKTLDRASPVESTPQGAEATLEEGASDDESLPMASTESPEKKHLITPTPHLPQYPSTRYLQNSRMIDPSIIETPPVVSAAPTSQPSR